MTLQNRVLPTGEILAHPAHGTLMGNRGILHDDTQRLGTVRWTHQAWVTCLLTFKGRQRALMSPRRYTELFFLDEAVAMAAGHRPCGECRRNDYARFRRYWDQAHGPCDDIKAIDRQMHQCRVTRARAQIRPHTSPTDLPDGAFILWQDMLCLVWQGMALTYTPQGYTHSHPMPTVQEVTLLTPSCTIAVLAAGYRPTLHPTAQAHLPVV